MRGEMEIGLGAVRKSEWWGWMLCCKTDPNPRVIAAVKLIMKLRQRSNLRGQRDLFWRSRKQITLTPLICLAALIYRGITGESCSLAFAFASVINSLHKILSHQL